MDKNQHKLVREIATLQQDIEARDELIEMHKREVALLTEKIKRNISLNAEDAKSRDEKKLELKALNERNKRNIPRCDDEKKLELKALNERNKRNIPRCDDEYRLDLIENCETDHNDGRFTDITGHTYENVCFLIAFLKALLELIRKCGYDDLPNNWEWMIVAIRSTFDAMNNKEKREMLSSEFENLLKGQAEQCEYLISAIARIFSVKISIVGSVDGYVMSYDGNDDYKHDQRRHIYIKNFGMSKQNRRGTHYEYILH